MRLRKLLLALVWAAAFAAATATLVQAAVSGWVADASRAAIPKTPVTGRIRGKEFMPKSVEIRNSASVKAGGFSYEEMTLTLRSSDSLSPETGVEVTVAVPKGKKLDGMTFSRVPGSRQPVVGPGTPQLQGLSYERGRKAAEDEEDHDTFRTFKGSVRVAFGTRQGKVLPGSLYVCFDDEEKSYLAGAFQAALK